MIEIKGKDPLLFQNDHIISKLYRFIKQDVAFFIVLRDVLLTYGEVQFFDAMEYEKDKEILKLNYPSLKELDTEDFFNTLESVFTEHFSDDQEGYKKFRGDFTEYVVSESGPYFYSLTEVSVTREAVFIKDGQLLQPIPQEEHHHNVDVCFHEIAEFSSIQEVTCEVIECKIKIENFLRKKLFDELPAKKKDRQDRDKIKYMEALGNYFTSSKMFKIAFATLTMNVNHAQQWLGKFPALQVELISGKMIENTIKNKLAN